MDTLAALFHLNSSLHPALPSPGRPVLPSPPPPLSPTAEHLPLPTAPPPTASLGSVLMHRRSRRDSHPEPASMALLAQALRAGVGITGVQDGHPLRAAPSAGALRSNQIVVLAGRVTSLEDGRVYRYDEHRDILERLTEPCWRRWALVPEVLSPAVDTAAVLLALVADFGPVTTKYGPRGYRYTLIEAGHIAQNILLTWEAGGRPACPVGAFHDQALNTIVGTDGVQSGTVYLLLLG